jgi:hypothetical protein
MRERILILICAAVLAGNVFAADVLSPERTLARAKVLVEESDFVSAIPLLIDALRRAENEEVRKNAREELEDLGLTRQEVFAFDAAGMTADDWSKLLKRVNATALAHKRQELDFDYAVGLLNLAVVPRSAPAGAATVEIDSKQLARALDLLMQLALTDGDKGTEAQARLEALGIFGPKAESTRKAVAEGTVPAAIQTEVACTVCIQQLAKYKEWAERTPENDEQSDQKAVGIERGKALYFFMKKDYLQAAAFKRDNPVLSYWETATGTNEADRKF